MFPTHNNYGQIPRNPIASSSFYIRDILGNDSSFNDNGKFGVYDTGNYLQNYSTTNPTSPVLTYPSFGYHSSFRGFASDCLDPTATPVPLPVYIRSRSPLDLDEFSKPKRCRRSRTVFTELQLMGLEKKFESHKYLSTPDRIELAERLGLSQVQVKTWYQNRRMKWKKVVIQKGATEAPTKPKGRPKKESSPSSLESSDLQSDTSVNHDNSVTNTCTNYLKFDNESSTDM